MTEDTQSWTVGEVRITSIVEAQTDGIPPQFFFPEKAGLEFALTPYLERLAAFRKQMTVFSGVR